MARGDETSRRDALARERERARVLIARERESAKRSPILPNALSGKVLCALYFHCVCMCVHTLWIFFVLEFIDDFWSLYTYRLVLLAKFFFFGAVVGVGVEIKNWLSYSMLTGLKIILRKRTRFSEEISEIFFFFDKSSYKISAVYNTNYLHTLSLLMHVVF